MIIAAVAACIILAVCFPANPAARLRGTEYEYGNLTVTGSGTDCEGVEISMRAWKLDAIPTTLTATWRNGSDSDITYGDYYWVYKYENGKWISSAKERSVDFNDIGYPLTSGEERVKNYYNYSFDLSKTGIYRLESYFFFDKDIPITKDGHHNVWIEFEITQSAPPKSAGTGA